MEILVVEDENRLRTYLESALKQGGHSVSGCSSYDDALTWMKVQTHQPEIVILDRMLHGQDGLSLIPPFRTHYPECKIIILSAIGLADEKAQALDQGADDYLSKPFSLNELTARIRVLGRRRSTVSSSSVLKLQNLLVDLKTQSVSVEDKKIDLSKKEFQLLSLLMGNPGRVFDKFQILDRVWDQQIELQSNVVEVTIKNIRRKLESSDCSAKVMSKRNIGYWIE